MHVGEGKSWVGDGGIESKIKMVQDVLQDIKCSLIRVPFFFVQTILIIGMHNFFNMQIKF